MKVGDKVKVKEGNYLWDGEVVFIDGSIVETKHRRDKEKHPEWNHYSMVWLDIYTKHFNKDNILTQIQTNDPTKKTTL